MGSKSLFCDRINEKFLKRPFCQKIKERSCKFIAKPETINSLLAHITTAPGKNKPLPVGNRDSAGYKPKFGI